MYIQLMYEYTTSVHQKRARAGHGEVGRNGRVGGDRQQRRDDRNARRRAILRRRALRHVQVQVRALQERDAAPLPLERAALAAAAARRASPDQEVLRHRVRDPHALLHHVAQVTY